MKFVLLATLVGSLTTLTASAGGAADQPVSAAQRQAQIERIRDGLNSPDSARRLATLEQAVASKDGTLRRVALSTAFASSDSDLRSVALTAAISSTATFVVNVAVSGHTRDSDELLAVLGTTFEVRVAKFDRSTNTFQTWTSASNAHPGATERLNSSEASHSGAVSGERLSFAFDINRVMVAGPEVCSGVAVLPATGTTLRGSLNCTGYFNSNFAISIDIMK